MLARPVSILVGEVGAGKSLTLDRLFQRTVVRLREETDAPLPAFVEAWEVERSLEYEVVQKTSALDDPRRRGAAIFVDGAEEAGRGRAGRLLTEARRLVHTWPDTTVVIAGRPIPEFTGDPDSVEMPSLTEEETKALLERVSGQELQAMDTHGWPASVEEAVRRPFFATLVGMDIRERDLRNPRSTAELLSRLVDRALERADEAVELDQLRLLAVASIDRGGPVRTSDVATTVEARHLRATGLVSERNGTIAFSLQILNEWFAAQALETGLVDPSELASDLARLECWRYPLAIATGTFGYARVERILGPIVRSAPAFASQVVEEGLARWSFAEDASRSPLEQVARQMREAMGSWVEGIGPLAPLIAPVCRDGSLAPLGVGVVEGRITDVSWYRGSKDYAAVVTLSREVLHDIPNHEWPGVVRMFRPGGQPAWAWRWTLEDLTKKLSDLLGKRRLPVTGGLLAEEAAWDAAREMRKQFDGSKYREREPIPLEAIDGYLDRVGWDTEVVSFARLQRPDLRYELRYLKDKISGLRDAGERELRPPWPVYDRMPGDPGYVKTGRESAWVWEWYSPEALLERVRIILEGTLGGYRRFAEEIFSRLAPNMLIAATLPARLVGTLILTPREGRPDIGPYVSWHLEPLPEGSEDEIRVEIGQERPGREHMLGVQSRTRSMRPQAAAWISPYDYAAEGFYGQTPATELAYELLWADLKRVSWVDGMFNRRFL